MLCLFAKTRPIVTLKLVPKKSVSGIKELIIYGKYTYEKIKTYNKDSFLRHFSRINLVINSNENLPMSINFPLEQVINIKHIF